jgi:hypothetical protein
MDLQRLDAKMSQIRTASTRAALALLPSPAAGDYCILAGRTAVGDAPMVVARFDTSNLSAEVTADTLKIEFIAPSGQTGSQGAWRIVYPAGEVPCEHASIFSGTADNGANLQTALNYCRLRGLRLTGDLAKQYPITTACAWTTAGTYRVKNLRVDGSASTAELLMSVAGPAWGSAIVLTANAAYGATSLTVGSGLTIPDGLYWLYDTRDGCDDIDGGGSFVPFRHGEWVKVTGYSGTTITLAAPLVTVGFLTASSAALRQLKASETVFDVEGLFEIEGDHTTDTQRGLLINRATLRADRLRAIGTKNIGFDCSEALVDVGHVYGEDCDRDGSGYAIETVGCYAARVGGADGKRCRHVHVSGAGYSGDAWGPVQSAHERIGDVFSEEAYGSGKDVHPGAYFGKCGAITTEMDLAAASDEEAVTVQSPGWSFGPIRCNGSDREVVLYQDCGHRLGPNGGDLVEAAVTTFGPIHGIMSSGDSTDLAVLVQSLATTMHTVCRLAFDAVNLYSDAGGLYVDATNADFDVTVNAANIRGGGGSSIRSGVTALAPGAYRSLITINGGRVRTNSTSSASGALRAEGSLALIRMNGGVISAGSGSAVGALAASSSVISLGSNVEIASGGRSGTVMRDDDTAVP